MSAPAIETVTIRTGARGDYCDACNTPIAPYRNTIQRVPDRQFPVTLKRLVFCSRHCEESAR